MQIVFNSCLVQIWKLLDQATVPAISELGFFQHNSPTIFHIARIICISFSNGGRYSPAYRQRLDLFRLIIVIYLKIVIK